MLLKARPPVPLLLACFLGCAVPRIEAPGAPTLHSPRVRLDADALAHGDVVRMGPDPSQGAVPIMAVAFLPKKNLLASGNHEGLIQFWDVATGRQVESIKTSGSFITALAINPEGTSVASANWEDIAHVWSIGTSPDRAVWELKPAESAAAVAFSPDGKRVATGGEKVVCLWDATSGRRLGRFEGHQSLVRCVAFSPDGERLASAGQDDTLRIWDLSAGRELVRRTGGTSDIHALAYSPDGSTLAWADAGWPFDVHLLDAVRDREILKLSGHRGSVQSLAFSSGGRSLASGGADGIIRLWSVETGACVMTLEAGKGQVNSVAFSTDASELASGSSDGSVLVWKVPLSATLR